MNNLRYSLRTLARAPGFTLSAVLDPGAGHRGECGRVLRSSTRFSSTRCRTPTRVASSASASRIRRRASNAVTSHRGPTLMCALAVERSSSVGSVFIARRWLLSFGDEPEAAQRRTELTPSVFRRCWVLPPSWDGRFAPEADQLPPYGDDGEVVISYSPVATAVRWAIRTWWGRSSSSKDAAR